jgi:hypothetical protein
MPSQISKAREKRSPPASSRPTPVTSRRVSPVTQPLIIRKRSAPVDLAHVDNKLARLSVAPLALALKTKPVVLAVRSCLKITASARAAKSVRFVNYGGWNIHRIRAFQPDTAPNTFIQLTDAVLCHPTAWGRDKGPVYPGNYSIVLPDKEIRWPPPDHDGPIRRATIPSRCLTCAQVAAQGTPHIRYRPVQVSVWCQDCLADPARRPYYVPPLDDDGDDDYLDTCPGPHNKTPQECQYYSCAFKANVLWLYANYIERYKQCDDILND